MATYTEAQKQQINDDVERLEAELHKAKTRQGEVTESLMLNEYTITYQHAVEREVIIEAESEDDAIAKFERAEQYGESIKNHYTGSVNLEDGEWLEESFEWNDVALTHSDINGILKQEAA